MLYLAYGSNMLSARLRERVPSARVLGRGQLQGWVLKYNKCSIDTSGKCNIFRSEEPRVIVHGAVFEIAPLHREWLDKVEGPGYRRQDVRVRAAEETLRAFTYVAEESYLDDSLVPYSWYRDLVVAGAREHGLPEEYVQKSLAVQARLDQDADRDATKRSLLGP